MTKPTLPQGTRDFGPEIVRKRNYILNTIRSVFELYGYQPLETPAMENLDTLLGKYGEEGDKLIFRVINNGLDNPAKREQLLEDFEKLLQGKNSKNITERALKYDLTIPFARYVAMNHSQLVFPFKRYQIQSVWRADRPQKGRYREFCQCDADVVGSQSLINEVEFLYLYHTAFSQLGITDYELRINSRKILAALAELCGSRDRFVEITTAIDKLDKTGLDKVKQELTDRGFNSKQLEMISKYLDIQGSNLEKINQVTALLGEMESAKDGIAELEFIRQTIDSITKTSSGTQQVRFEFDFTLARGLNYYTGIIIEAKAPVKVNIGSLGGGGRYNDLTGLFGLAGIPGVGISFGLDRIYDTMEELNLFPDDVNTGTQALFFNLGENESLAAFSAMQQLRMNGIRCELYHENSKFDKQFKYAEKKSIPFVVIIGTEEIIQKTCVVKDLRSGQQQTIPLVNLGNLSFI